MNEKKKSNLALILSTIAMIGVIFILFNFRGSIVQSESDCDPCGSLDKVARSISSQLDGVTDNGAINVNLNLDSLILREIKKVVYSDDFIKNLAAVLQDMISPPQASGKIDVSPLYKEIKRLEKKINECCSDVQTSNFQTRIEPVPTATKVEANNITGQYRNATVLAGGCKFEIKKDPAGRLVDLGISPDEGCKVTYFYSDELLQDIAQALNTKISVQKFGNESGPNMQLISYQGKKYWIYKSDYDAVPGQAYPWTAFIGDGSSWKEYLFHALVKIHYQNPRNKTYSYIGDWLSLGVIRDNKLGGFEAVDSIYVDYSPKF